jgi:hypothetical protein
MDPELEEFVSEANRRQQFRVGRQPVDGER